MKTKLISLLVIGMLLPQACFPMDMNEIFDGINANGNVNGPGIIKGQTQNVMTGGSIYMRVPKRSYNLASMSAPSYSAGCGGIDIYAGSFSYINEQAFVDMMRNIGQNALGYAFKLAIDNLCAPCANVMQALDSTARAINSNNIDSCKAAEGIVNAAASTVFELDSKNTAKNFGMEMGDFSDAAEAWSKVDFSTWKTSQINKKAQETRPDLADKVPHGNVVWKALKKIQGITDQHREMLMSLTGTVVVDPETNLPTPYGPTQISITDIIGTYGSQNATMMIRKCIDGYGENQCTSLSDPVATDINQKSFRTLVAEKLNSLRDKISNRSAYGADQAELVNFVGVVHFPVYKMIAVSASYNNTEVTDALISKYTDAIAARYAQVFINESAREVIEALNYYQSKGANSNSTTITDKIIPDLIETQKKIRDEVMEAEQKAVAGYSIALEVQSLERVMSSNMSQILRNSMAFGKTVN